MHRRMLVVLVSALAVLGLIVPAQAAPSDDGPLPGYTINNPPLAPLTVGGLPTSVLQGVYRHAAYDLEIPQRWNGELVMWAHGYRGETTVLTVDPPAYGLRRKFLDEGYAWAASSYTRNSYDPRSGIVSTHDLARHVSDLLSRAPSRTYIVGVSMGGHVIGRSLEQYPKFYAGALPMCGVLGDDDLFDFFLDYNLAAQTLAGVPAYPVPADYLSADVPRIEVALGLATITPGQDPTNALGRELQQITVQRSGGARPGALASFSLWKDFLFGLYRVENGGTLAQNPGRLAQNLTTLYQPLTPVNLNRTVPRVGPVDIANRLTYRLNAIPRIAGNPQVPVLTLHGLGDMFVPFSMEELYAQRVALHHESGLLVQRAVREAGHCEFTPTEAGRAWSDLRAWVEHGVHPAGDAVANPRVVATPTFGCAFTDQSAYSDPTDFPTRALFAPCTT